VQHLSLVSVVVKEYDEAIRFYTEKLGFVLVEDTPLPEGKRWVVVAPPGAGETRVLLARASDEQQEARVGNQTGGRVFLFLTTDTFEQDYEDFKSRGVEFVREPMVQAYGKVAVFADLYGNLWDLLGPAQVSLDGAANSSLSRTR
jgi:catechol 2,3-dioxygenase-like lactoylglutathione lyase family enzyme